MINLGLSLQNIGGGELSFFDEFGTPAAAYSLRDLSGSGDAVVRVRRDSDNSEQDFTASEITDGTLTTFVGAGNNGLVSIWYDQAGTNDASQATASEQPLIIDTGALVTKNGKPAIFGNSANNTSLSSSTTAIQPLTFASVASFEPIGGAVRCLISGLTGFYYVYNLNGSVPRLFAGGSPVNYNTAVSNAQKLFSGIVDDANTEIFANAASATGSAGTRNPSGICFFNLANGSIQPATGYISEFILYDSAKSNLPEIRTNINDHYTIY